MVDPLLRQHCLILLIIKVVVAKGGAAVALHMEATTVSTMVSASFSLKIYDFRKYGCFGLFLWLYGIVLDLCKL